MGFGGRLRKLLFGVSLQEADFARRGFPLGDPGKRKHLEARARTYLLGVNESFNESRSERLAPLLDTFEPELRGFAYEGAAMGLTVLDTVAPFSGGRRLRRYLLAEGRPHTYMAYVGAGMAFAALHLSPGRFLRSQSEMSRWLVYNGVGFYQAFFGRTPGTPPLKLPARLLPIEALEFDAGTGRALWFICSADPARVRAWIDGCAPERRPHLWSGVGLACAYAGGVTMEEVAVLQAEAGAHHASLAVGMALATNTRFLANNPTPHLEAVVQQVWGRSSARLHHDVEVLRHGVGPDTDGRTAGAPPSWEVFLGRLHAAALERVSAGGLAA